MKTFNEDGSAYMEMEYAEGKNIAAVGKWISDNGYIYYFDEDVLHRTSPKGIISEIAYKLTPRAIITGYRYKGREYQVTKFLDGVMHFNYKNYRTCPTTTISVEANIVAN
jgi:hypothetical protein